MRLLQNRCFTRIGLYKEDTNNSLLLELNVQVHCLGRDTVSFCCPTSGVNFRQKRLKLPNIRLAKHKDLQNALVSITFDCVAKMTITNYELSNEKVILTNQPYGMSPLAPCIQAQAEAFAVASRNKIKQTKRLHRPHILHNSLLLAYSISL